MAAKVFKTGASCHVLSARVDHDGACDQDIARERARCWELVA